MNMNQRQQRVTAAIEMLEEVVLDVLKPTQEQQFQMDGTPVPDPIDTRNIAVRAGIPAPRETALTRYVLEQLQKAGQVREIRYGRKSLGWEVV